MCVCVCVSISPKWDPGLVSHQEILWSLWDSLFPLWTSISLSMKWKLAKSGLNPKHPKTGLRGREDEEATRKKGN